MLKKFLIGTLAVMAVFIATTAFAADFGTTTLRVGSKGEAVKAVQTLVGATADGSFGPMTAAKVKVWQAANGLTADGVFGAMSKAKANGGAVVTSAGCPAGALFNSLTGASCTTVTSTVAGCTAGALFSSTTGAACTGTTGTVTTGTLAGGVGDMAAGYPKLLGTPSNKAVGEGDSAAQVLGFE
ncbi:MAG: peptidoglycan-binding domain-containing protein, partial [Candidatus Nomurabacteria bacterium]|nr:peptidoglycan-binding domain-containing protein [Candidatus Nomurabacteria bacterium]